MEDDFSDHGEISLDLIRRLGGVKEDLQLINDNSDDVEVLEIEKDDDAEPIKKDDIRNLIKELEIFKYRPDAEEKEQKKRKKLLVADEAEEDSAPSQDGEKKKKSKKKKKEEEQAASVSSTVEVKTTTKKSKNKFKVQHNEVSSSTSAGVDELAQHLQTQPQHHYLLVKPGDTWIDSEAITGSAGERSADLVQKCKNFAAQVLEKEVAAYKKYMEKHKKSDSGWIRTVLATGTLSDKMAALTTLVLGSSLHNLAAIDMLLAMAKKKGKREAILASETLKNIVTSETSPLPDDCKLVSFDTRPFSSLWQMSGGNRDTINKHLMAWYAEDQLKHKYADYIKALDVMSHDSLLAMKEKSLAIIHSLLSSKPEQEDALLPMLVNKLGDPNHKVSSKASYLLIKLVEEHPNMKSVIVGEIERLIYRPNIAQKAQYYAMCFLNQIKFHKGDKALAEQLIGIFFSFFKVYVKKGEVDSKMMAALLTGVNRAFPYAKSKCEFLITEVSALVHLVNFNTCVQVLMLFYQLVDLKNNNSDRYFMALYRKLVDPALRLSSKQPQFLNLLFKSMKFDVVEKRVQAFLKRLLQAGSLLGPNFLCGALIVISEVLKERPHLLIRKQLGKVTADKNKSIIGGAVSNTDDPKEAIFDDEDEEERFVDVPLPPEFQEGEGGEEEEAGGDGGEAAAGVAEPLEEKDAEGDSKGIPTWLHRKNVTGKSDGGYDHHQRNPLHCNAQSECLWELQALTHHYHPSVSLFARTILQGQSIEYSGDPLQDFTLIRFLDRFVYKNPKKKEALPQYSRAETVGAVSRKGGKEGEIIPVNSEEFIKGGEEAVPEHERYLYRYFSQRAEKKAKKEEEESEAESVSDSEFDTFLDKYERQMDEDDLDDMDFGPDFARDLGKKKNQKGKKRKDSSDEDIDDDEEDDDDDDDDDDVDDFGGLSDEEMDFADDEDDELAAEFRKEMEGLGDDSEDEDEMAEEEDEDLSGDELKQMMTQGSKKRGKTTAATFDAPARKKAKKSRHDGLESIFASADDFADILESNAEANSNILGTLDDVRNTDKSSAKQIAWEAERDRQTRGKDWRQNRRQGKPKFKGGKPMKQGRQGGNLRHQGHKGRQGGNPRHQGHGKKRKR